MRLGDVAVFLWNIFVPDLRRFINVTIAIKNRERLGSSLSVVSHEHLHIYDTKTRFGVGYDLNGLLNLSRIPLSLRCIPDPTLLRNPATRLTVGYRRRCHGRNRCAAQGERIRAAASADCTFSNCCNSCPLTEDNIPAGWPAVGAEKP